MLENLVTDKYYKSIYDINYKSLKKSNIKCLIFDLSNTLVPETVKEPTKRLKDLFEDLKDMGFKLIIMSNNIKSYVRPFKEILCVDSCYLSFKPSKNKYKKVIKMYDYTNEQIACIGDQLITDVCGANKMDFTSILVNPISADEYVSSKFSRKIENIFVRKLSREDLFKRGRYYE